MSSCTPTLHLPYTHTYTYTYTCTYPTPTPPLHVHLPYTYPTPTPTPTPAPTLYLPYTYPTHHLAVGCAHAAPLDGSTAGQKDGQWFLEAYQKVRPCVDEGPRGMVHARPPPPAPGWEGNEGTEGNG